MSYEKHYYSYLRTRSLKSFLYRKYFIYPKYKPYMNGLLLDVGCGIGEILEYYNNSIGVDINSECVKFCKNKGLDSRVMEEDKLPFDNEKFDTLTFENVLEHIKNPNKIIKEIYRVMKYQAHILISVPGIKGFHNDPDHKQHYDKKKLNELFKMNNFQLIKNYYTPFKSKFLDDVICID